MPDWAEMSALPNIREKLEDIFHCSGARWDFYVPRPVMLSSMMVRCCRLGTGFILEASTRCAVSAWDELSPRDEYGYAYGGNKFVQLNVEYIFPLIKDIGLMGVIFFDTGNLYDDDQDIDLGDLRQDTGFGVRWFSPVGPIRVEYGFIIDPQPGESSNGRWEFSMGQTF